MGDWYFEGHVESNDALQRLPLTSFPVLVGRQEGLALAGASPNMSRYHAEIVDRGGRLYVRDLGSKNGTYVNRERLESERALEEGDVVHFADAGFRLVRAGERPASVRSATGVFPQENLPNQLPLGSRELERLLDTRAMTAVFQPIVSLADERTVALECLARGNSPNLPRAPRELFRIAASVGRAIELSELMRERGTELAAATGFSGPTFINLYPTEVTEGRERLLEHLERLRHAHPGLHLVLELHEAAVTDLEAVGQLDRDLHTLGVDLAYDDFGAGRARLMELASVPPRYLKFDISMIADIDTAADGHRRMVGLLTSFAHEMAITTLAEGIARPREAQVCAELGFDLGQGYYFGRPAPFDADEDDGPRDRQVPCA